jgi:hypothetical protein
VKPESIAVELKLDRLEVPIVLQFLHLDDFSWLRVSIPAKVSD